MIDADFFIDRYRTLIIMIKLINTDSLISVNSDVLSNQIDQINIVFEMVFWVKMKLSKMPEKNLGCQDSDIGSHYEKESHFD